MDSTGTGDIASDVNLDDDVKLVAEDDVIDASRMLLSRHSSYFAAMFNSDMRERHQDVITLHDVMPDVLRALVHFSRTQEMEFSTKNVYNVLGGACMLQFGDIIEQSSAFLLRKLDSLTCLTTMFMAARYGLQLLHAKARRLTLWYFPTISFQEDFLQLPLDAVKELLSEDMLNIESENEVVEAGLRWLDYEERTVHSEQVFSVCRLGLLTIEQLTYLQQHTLVENPASAGAQQLVSRVLQCKMSHAVESTSIIPQDMFKPRQIKRDIFLIGGILLHRDSKANHRDICVFDRDKMRLDAVYYNIPPLQNHTKLCTGYRAYSTGRDIYLCGGEVALGRDGWQMNMWKFDSFLETWQCVSKIPQPRRHFSLVAMDTELYLIGGFGRHRVILDCVDVYDYKKGVWTTAPPLNRAVFSAASCCHKNKIYVIKHEIEAYSRDDSRWTTLTLPLPFEIGIHECVSYQGNIYFLSSFIRDLIELNCETLEMRNIGRFKDACGGCVLVDKKIYVLSGDESDYVESYDIEKDQFCVECRIDVPIHSHCVVTLLKYPQCDWGG